MRNKVRISMMAGIVLVIAVLCACGNASDKETSNEANGSDSNNSGTEVQVGELIEFNYYPGYSDMDGGYHYEVLKKNDDGEWIFESENQNSLDDPLITTIYAVTKDDVKEFEKFLSEKGVVSLQERMDSDVFVTDYSPWSYSIVFADPSSDEGKEIRVSIGQYKDYSDEDYELLKELGQRFQDLKGVVLSETVETEEEEETTKEEASESQEGNKAGPDVITLGNPTWDYYYVEYQHPDAEYISLEKLTEDKSDWLDTDKWASENGFRLELMPYGDDDYYYEPYEPIDYNYMFNALKIYDKGRKNLLYDLDLHVLVNGPDEENGRTAAVTEYIRWAQLYEGILYIAAGHNTYASSEPDSSYVMAIDLAGQDAPRLLWRSKPLVSNALNFKIVRDTIICGYGFTAEDDFIYLLDRYTGETVDKIKVNSGPDQFEIVDDTLYVATYNTAYTFRIQE